MSHLRRKAGAGKTFYLAKIVVSSIHEKYQLWDALLKAYSDQNALEEISFSVQSLHSCMSGADGQIESPISEGLRSLFARTKELSDAFQTYEEEIELSYQNVAWQYALIGYGIRKGDRIEFKDWRGPMAVGAADKIILRERTMGELTLRVLLLKKDGKIGKRESFIQLAHEKWENLDNKAFSQSNEN